MVPNQDKVKETLKEIQGVLAQIPQLAFEGWRNSSEYAISGNHPRLRANIIWAWMIYHAKEMLRDNRRIDFVHHHNTVSLVVDGLNHLVLMRLKKADRRGISRNVQTLLSEAYHDHSKRYLFDNMSDPDRIEIVYILNRLGSAIEDVRVVGRSGRHVVWFYSILPEADIFNVPQPPPTTTPESEDEIVRVARETETQKAEKK